jgi:MoxR-like ATPase
MEERQITIAEKTYPIPAPFMVLATQNPIDHGREPTAFLKQQLDRFMLKVHVDDPTREEERLIDLMSNRSHPMPEPIIDANVILHAKEVVESIYVDDKIKDYVLDLVFATRDPAQAGIPELQEDIKLGASPRASLSLLRASKANAFIRGRGYVTPDDVKQVLFDVVRHRSEFDLSFR